MDIRSLAGSSGSRGGGEGSGGRTGGGGGGGGGEDDGPSRGAAQRRPAATSYRESSQSPPHPQHRDQDYAEYPQQRRPYHAPPYMPPIDRRDIGRDSRREQPANPSSGNSSSRPQSSGFASRQAYDDGEAVAASAYEHHAQRRQAEHQQAQARGTRSGGGGGMGGYEGSSRVGSELTPPPASRFDALTSAPPAPLDRTTLPPPPPRPTRSISDPNRGQDQEGAQSWAEHEQHVYAPPLRPSGALAPAYSAPPIAQGGMPAPPRLSGAEAFGGPGGGGYGGGSSAGGQAAGSSSKSGGGQDATAGSSTAVIRSQLSAASKATLEGTSTVRNGLRYRLVVIQHPNRARMCGFGDKDRRPLSPTLIAKVIITDEATGREVPPWEVNSSLFFLASDLCHPDELMATPRSVLVHHHATTVPTAALRSGLDMPESRPRSSSSQRGLTVEAPIGRGSAVDMRISTAAGEPLGPQGERGYPAPGPVAGQLGQQGHLGQSRQGAMTTYATAPVAGPTGKAAPVAGNPSMTTVTTESYTRNLVGAAVASANILRDENDQPGIFFVMQDLSVRTEGVYRIKLTFVDLANGRGESNGGVSHALSEAYTEPFTVYSPRRFPGVLEPTELSKKLASQGIKINTRGSDRKRRYGGPAGGRGGGDDAGGGGDDDDMDDD